MQKVHAIRNASQGSNLDACSLLQQFGRIGSTLLTCLTRMLTCEQEEDKVYWPMSVYSLPEVWIAMRVHSIIHPRKTPLGAHGRYLDDCRERWTGIDFPCKLGLKLVVSVRAHLPIPVYRICRDG